MKTRKVMAMVEIESDLALGVIKKHIRYWLGWRVRIKQIQLNVIQGNKSKRRR